jgi:cell shape-determining protein MreC
MLLACHLNQSCSKQRRVPARIEKTGTKVIQKKKESCHELEIELVPEKILMQESFVRALI